MFQIGFFSGVEFNVAPDIGLSGYCDYILTASKDMYEIRTPILTLVEAKNENIKSGLGQCIAEMIAAQILNLKEDKLIPVIYGVITTGTIWKFLKLEGSQVFIDIDDYFIKEINKLLGISHTASTWNRGASHSQDNYLNESYLFYPSE